MGKTRRKKYIKNFNYKRKHSRHTRRKHSRHTHMKRSSGGRAIEAGTYGCVFSPALKCADKTIPYDPKYISKLMFAKDAVAEKKEMSNVKKIVTTIPNNDKYFIVGSSYLCKPDVIEGEEDLLTFDDTCELFTKRNYNSANINQSLNEVTLLNMPNGGLGLDKFFENMIHMKNMYETFIKTNNSLIDLLINGIIPLNKKNFNHFDVKDNNILISPEGDARLIDWGLASANDNFTVPDTMINRPITFNVPYSDIFFNTFMKQMLPMEYKNIKPSIYFTDKNAGQMELLKVIVMNALNKSLDINGEGHFRIILGILQYIYKIYALHNKHDQLNYNTLAINVLVEYITAVLVAYTDDNGNFNEVKYFYEVFTYNADVWGFILSYLKLIENGFGVLHKDFINALCRIFIRFCYSTEFAAKRIDVNELVVDLKSLNTIAESLLVKSKSKTKSNPSYGKERTKSYRQKIRTNGYKIKSGKSKSILKK